MRVNEHIALITPKVLLVPYSEHHVPTYHEWMKDEALQKATASEPLTLAEEHTMQRSWRQDADKLTFILCLAPDAPVPRLLAPGHADSPARMLGDVNLFLSDDESFVTASSSPAGDDAPRYVVGELELMIAVRAQRRKGYGRAALVAFVAYVRDNLGALLEEYAPGTEARLSYLRVRIGAENEGSIALFEGMGFKKVSETPNFFGEVELRRNVDSMWDREGGWKVVPYGVEDGS